eukprot:gene6579-9162_t
MNRCEEGGYNHSSTAKRRARGAVAARYRSRRASSPVSFARAGAAQAADAPEWTNFGLTPAMNDTGFARYLAANALRIRWSREQLKLPATESDVTAEALSEWESFGVQRKVLSLPADMQPAPPPAPRRRDDANARWYRAYVALLRRGTGSLPDATAFYLKRVDIDVSEPVEFYGADYVLDSGHGRELSQVLYMMGIRANFTLDQPAPAHVARAHQPRQQRRRHREMRDNARDNERRGKIYECLGFYEGHWGRKRRCDLSCVADRTLSEIGALTKE